MFLFRHINQVCIKTNRIIFLLLIMCMAILFTSCGNLLNKNAALKETIIDSMKLVSTMFPEEKFIKQGNYYNAGERKNYYVESIIPGSFVNRDGEELLVVVRRPSDELSHVEGFYNAYMGVFDNKSGNMISEVKLFSVDEGEYKFFESKGISYIFFSGSTTYQGYSNWYGGLWQVGSKWTMKWPAASENNEYYDFWQNRAVEVNNYGINILERKLLPKEDTNQTIPNYTFELSKKMYWDKEMGEFVVAEE